MAESKKLLTKSFFSHAPFHVVPTDENLVWAGSAHAKHELSRIVQEVTHEGLELSHMCLIYGEYGCGKTHALKYFSSLLRGDGRSLVAYLPKPKVERKGSFQGIAKEVIQQIGRNPLKRAATPIISFIARETARQVQEALRTASPEQLVNVSAYMNEVQATAKRNLQEILYPAFPEIFNVLDGLSKDDPEAWYYFAAKPSKNALQRFELNSPIEDDHDALRTLAALYTVLTTKYVQIPSTPVFQSAYIFVDEMEQFLEMRPEEYLSIRTGLRDLFNSCTQHFCILLAATAENASLFHGILEEAIMVRITSEPIHLSSHDEVEDGVQFLVDLIQYARNGIAAPTAEHPFTRESLEEIVSRTTEPRTARKLIQNSNRIWQACANTVLKGSAITATDVGRSHGLI